MPNAVYEPAACLRGERWRLRAKATFRAKPSCFEFTEHELVRNTSHLQSIITEYRRQVFTTLLWTISVPLRRAGTAGGLPARPHSSSTWALVRNIEGEPPAVGSSSRASCTSRAKLDIYGARRRRRDRGRIRGPEGCRRDPSSRAICSISSRASRHCPRSPAPWARRSEEPRDECRKPARMTNHTSLDDGRGGPCGPGADATIVTKRRVQVPAPSTNSSRHVAEYHRAGWAPSDGPWRLRRH